MKTGKLIFNVVFAITAIFFFTGTWSIFLFQIKTNFLLLLELFVRANVSAAPLKSLLWLYIIWSINGILFFIFFVVHSFISINEKKEKRQEFKKEIILEVLNELKQKKKHANIK